MHLVRRGNPESAFLAFLESYERFPAGREHELVLLFKGLDENAVTSFLERAAAHSPRTVFVPDRGLDLTAYATAAARLSHGRVFFANSFSELRVENWLEKLSAPLDTTDAGAAGATASWGSNLGYDLFQLGIGGGYASVFDDRAAVRTAMQQMTGAPHRGTAVHTLGNLVNAARSVRTRSIFPAVHLRTNAFLIERELLLGLRLGRLNSKRSTYRLESGRGSLTTQLRTRGRAAVTVDAQGVARTAPEWHLGDTFWQARQQDLLIADNQTRQYDAQPLEHRHVLSGFAWGPLARPEGPESAVPLN